MFLIPILIALGILTLFGISFLSMHVFADTIEFPGIQPAVVLNFPGRDHGSA
jgi:hypothetical protein